jgi:hypothetical protein
MQVLEGQATLAVGHRPAIQQEPSPVTTINRCHDTDGGPMSDDKPTEEEPTQPRTPPASAAAARRARRIGGRPVPTPPARAEAAPVPPAPAARDAVPEAVVKLAKPAPKAPAEPPAAAPEQTALPRRAAPAWLNWAPAAVLSAGALAIAVILIVFSHGVWWGPQPATSADPKTTNVVREQVLAAAKTCLATTNTYKYTELDAYEKRALDCATGRFSAQLRRTIETLIKVNAPKLKSSQTAQINRGGIEAVSPGGRQWTVLLFGQLTVVNANDPKGRTDPFAAQVRMERVNGSWLISGLTTVSTPLS